MEALLADADLSWEEWATLATSALPEGQPPKVVHHVERLAREPDDVVREARHLCSELLRWLVRDADIPDVALGDGRERPFADRTSDSQKLHHLREVVENAGSKVSPVAPVLYRHLRALHSGGNRGAHPVGWEVGPRDAAPYMLHAVEACRRRLQACSEMRG